MFLLPLFVGGCGGAGAASVGASWPAVSPPLAAQLLGTSFTTYSSYDPGGVDPRPLLPLGNVDFGVFERDCRHIAEADPIALRVRSAAGCPNYVEGLVLAHHGGSGWVSRIWLTVLDPTSDAPWGEEELRIYVDGRSEPLVRLRYADMLFAEHDLDPQAARMRSGSFVSYVPIPFADEVWVTLAGARHKVYYHQVDVITGMPSSVPPPRFRFARSVRAKRASAFPGFQLATTGPGYWLALTFEAAATQVAGLRKAMVRFEFDGVTSVAKVGDLCLARFRWVTWRTGYVDVAVDRDGGVHCTLRWGWPYANTGRLELQVEGATDIDLLAAVASASDAELAGLGRFLAVTATHTAHGPPELTWAKLSGRGRLVALVLQAAGAPDPDFSLIEDPFNFLEGDETLVVDGRVRTRGTGTEDLFNGGFYFREGPFAWQWGGLASKRVGADGWGEVQVARFYVGWDLREFRASFEGRLEIGAGHPGIAHDYRSLAILYLDPESLVR